MTDIPGWEGQPYRLAPKGIGEIGYTVRLPNLLIFGWQSHHEYRIDGHVEVQTFTLCHPVTTVFDVRPGPRRMTRTLTEAIGMCERRADPGSAITTRLRRFAPVYAQDLAAQPGDYHGPWMPATDAVMRDYRRDSKAADEFARVVSDADRVLREMPATRQTVR